MARGRFGVDLAALPGMRWIVALAFLSGCELFFGDGGSRPDVCAEPAIAPAEQLDPDSLACQSFGSTCNPECGPCPLTDQPEVSWGFCGGPCDALDETACAADSRCRVLRDIGCELRGDCFTTFLRCAPTDQAVDLSIDCNRTTDAWSCSRSSACTAWHDRIVVGTGGGGGTPAFTFNACTVEGESPGRCWAPVACDQAAPPCPPLEVPLVKDGCYTGACVPRGICEPQP